jgi:hypothetical protein
LIVSTNALYAGCRCLSKGENVYSSYSKLENFKLFECNFSNEEDVQVPVSYEELYKSKVIQLYNNAGICLNGIIIDSYKQILGIIIIYDLSYLLLSKGSTQRILCQSVDINAIKPLKLARDLIKQCTDRVGMRCMILNISSGDGELLNLNSKLQSELKLLSTFNVISLILYHA